MMRRGIYGINILLAFLFPLCGFLGYMEIDKGIYVAVFILTILFLASLADNEPNMVKSFIAYTLFAAIFFAGIDESGIVYETYTQYSTLSQYLAFSLILGMLASMLVLRGIGIAGAILAYFGTLLFGAITNQGMDLASYLEDIAYNYAQIGMFGWDYTFPVLISMLLFALWGYTGIPGKKPNMAVFACAIILLLILRSLLNGGMVLNMEAVSSVVFVAVLLGFLIWSYKYMKANENASLEMDADEYREWKEREKYENRVWEAERGLQDVREYKFSSESEIYDAEQEVQQKEWDLQDFKNSKEERVRKRKQQEWDEWL
ncbi:hypothetical protein FZC78_07800 [Rossellomorea vietnamensis]|uniref:Uncharacterized protein n=1 Tax=Rossellomorea vietnamensis TaxID=218284 RepID=A0A5D4NWA0_9BACI|nr:hypothetical protein [Rossellomorea vietnamensis]TYS17754.1 hypothetical protein FZC78_07800 [Rossellomorea vietnamensis]